VNTPIDIANSPPANAPACDETNIHYPSSVEIWGQLLGGAFLIAAGLRRNSFTGGVMASIGCCLALRGAGCLFGDQSRIGATSAAERPDPAIVNNPVDEASWESFPASDSPFFSGITK
jgi:hypothetical protein